MLSRARVAEVALVALVGVESLAFLPDPFPEALPPRPLVARLAALALALVLALAAGVGHPAGTGDPGELNEALATCAPRGRLKTLWLVRHTRSKQNSGQSWFSSDEFKGSLLKRARGLWTMVTGFDAPPSSNGWAMLRSRAPALTPRLAAAGIDVAFYSPLVRAAATHRLVLGDLPMAHVPLRFLVEQGRREHAWADFGARVRFFEAAFLTRLPVPTVALVGHSKFFRVLLFGSKSDKRGFGYLLGNVDAWRVELDWGEAKDAHPARPAYRVVEVHTTADALHCNGAVELASFGALVARGAFVHVAPPPDGAPPTPALGGAELGRVLVERVRAERAAVEAHWAAHVPTGYPSVDESIAALGTLAMA